MVNDEYLSSRVKMLPIYLKNPEKDELDKKLINVNYIVYLSLL